VSAESIHAFIFEEQSRDKAVLFSTHQLESVELMADRVGVLAGGRLVAEGTVPELLALTEQPSLTRAFLRLVTRAAAEAA
jgi:ABC-type Na+ transport system ATPase subunit NatA